VIKVEHAKANIPCDVYWNVTRKCFSLRPHDTMRVCDYTDSILLDQATFHVNEAGRQRVLRTKEKNVHAWVTGYPRTYRSLVTDEDMPPLNIFPYRELTVRNVTYNPYKYNSFVRMDKTFEPVVVADRVVLSTWGNGKLRTPKIAAFREDMWGEFSPAHQVAYETMCDRGWKELSTASLENEAYQGLERLGVIWSQIAGFDQNTVFQYFWQEKTVSSLNVNVIRYGEEPAPWGWHDRTDYFHAESVSERRAVEEYIQWTARQR
jgi:hypothetical protein